MKRKRTEITIEFDEVIHLTNCPEPTQVWCAACGEVTTMVTPQQAAVITGATVRIINRWVESDVVHFVEPDQKLLLICMNSVRQRILSRD